MSKATLGRLLRNAEPAYIQPSRVENLASLPRYRATIGLVNMYHRAHKFRKMCMDELVKLSSSDSNEINEASSSSTSSSSSSTSSSSSESSSHHVKSLRQRLHKLTAAATTTTTNPFLTDGLAHYVAHWLSVYASDDFMFELAFRRNALSPANSHCDNRFFGDEPPSTRQLLRRVLAPASTDNATLVLEFGDTLLAEYRQRSLSQSAKMRHRAFYTDKPINTLIAKLSADIDAMRRSTTSTSTSATSSKPANTANNTKTNSEFPIDEFGHVVIASQKPATTKNTTTNPQASSENTVSLFVERNERLLLHILERMASLDIGELVNIGGVEFLLALYEKHPRSELYLNTIGKCLCLLSLDAKRHHLFVVSGWLKRLHHMLHSASADTNAATADADADANAGDSRDAILSHTENNINFVRETIAHKILFNLTTLSRWAVKNQSGDESSQATTPQPPPPPPPPPVYSTMLYPLWPYSGDEHEAAVTTVSSHHAHEFDVIFVHGLRGSLFRTWRQEDQLEIFDVDDVESEREKDGNAADEADDDEERNRTTRCWARDWLPLDVEEHMTLDNDDEENATAATAYKLRVLGVDYDSLYSLWGQELVDEKKLNLSIKKQAAQLAEQLRLAKVCLFFALFCSFCLK